MEHPFAGFGVVTSLATPSRSRAALARSVCLGLFVATLSVRAEAQNGAGADEIKQLQLQILEMQKKVDQILMRQDKAEREKTTPVPSANSVSAGDPIAGRRSAENLPPEAEGTSPNNPISGFKVGNTTLKFGGTLKVDLVEHFNQDLGHKNLALLIDPTLGSTAHTGGHFNSSVRPTTLTLDTSTPSSLGWVVTHVETDFDDSSGGTEQATNSYGMRLRRAYVATPSWLIGQDWSTFSDFNLGKILDYSAPIGTIFVRQPQVRYTYSATPRNFVDFAIENPDGAIRGTGGNISDSNNGFDLSCPSPTARDCGAQNPFPDAIARYRFIAGKTTFQVAGVARRLKLNGAPGEKVANGWGVDVGGSYALPTGTSLKVMLNGGKGFDRYVFGPYVGDAYISNDGNVTPIKRWSAVGTVSQNFGAQLVGNFIVGTTGVGNFSDQLAAINATCTFVNTKKGLGCVAERYSDLHANILYFPMKQLMLGLEYKYNRVVYRDSSHATVGALQFSVEYGF